ncbi:MAG TPA: hypothetical protein VLT87_10935 [Thermoanaerobaculia bacterium]|nr:hypothetical protein [Thermoanaerobaculia bacterium]
MKTDGALTTRPGKKGIGVLLDLMLSALFDGKTLEDVKRWDGERKGNIALPVNNARKGSGNYGVVARVLDLLAQRKDSNHVEWLSGWYLGQTSGEIGHCARETLSATYADAHLVPAHVLRFLAGRSEVLAPLRGLVSAFLENELALAVIHRDGRRHVVSASTRAMTGMSDARDQWVAQVLGEPLPHKGRGFRLLHFDAKQIRSWLDPELVADCRAFAETREVGTRLASVLARVRTVCGDLTWHNFERGHVSLYPEGPWCYAAGQPAAVGFLLDGREPILFNPAQDFRKPGIKGYGDVSTRLEDGVLRSWGDGKEGPWSREVALADLDLGELREVRVIRRVEGL